MYGEDERRSYIRSIVERTNDGSVNKTSLKLNTLLFEVVLLDTAH